MILPGRVTTGAKSACAAGAAAAPARSRAAPPAPSIAPTSLASSRVSTSPSSRAAERGTTPAWPSYFLKPSSTLAESGEPVARPPGCELLAFEGEVALVIGRRARRVSRADGWEHVAWITAANDFGVHDLRYADR